MIWHQRKKLHPELKDSFEQADLQEQLLFYQLKEKEVKKLTRQKGEEAKTLLKKEERKSLLLEKREEEFVLIKKVREETIESTSTWGTLVARTGWHSFHLPFSDRRLEADERAPSLTHQMRLPCQQKKEILLLPGCTFQQKVLLVGAYSIPGVGLQTNN